MTTLAPVSSLPEDLIPPPVYSPSSFRSPTGSKGPSSPNRFSETADGMEVEVEPQDITDKEGKSSNDKIAKGSGKDELKLMSTDALKATFEKKEEPSEEKVVDTNDVECPTDAEVIKVVEPILEEDYDLSVTDLYKQIETKQWPQVLASINLYPDQVKTWILRREKHDTSRLRWRLLPIHAAVIFQAPHALIEALLTSYPAGAASTDDQGMTPLHLAFRNGSSDAILFELLQAHPHGIVDKDRKNRYPLQLMPSSVARQEPDDAGSLRDKGARGQTGFALYVQLAVERETKSALAIYRKEVASMLASKEDEHMKNREVLLGQVADLQNSIADAQATAKAKDEGYNTAMETLASNEIVMAESQGNVEKKTKDAENIVAEMISLKTKAEKNAERLLLQYNTISEKLLVLRLERDELQDKCDKLTNKNNGEEESWKKESNQVKGENETLKMTLEAARCATEDLQKVSQKQTEDLQEVIAKSTKFMKDHEDVLQNLKADEDSQANVVIVRDGLSRAVIKQDLMIHAQAEKQRASIYESAKQQKDHLGNAIQMVKEITTFMDERFKDMPNNALNTKSSIIDDDEEEEEEPQQTAKAVKIPILDQSLSTLKSGIISPEETDGLTQECVLQKRSESASQKRSEKGKIEIKTEINDNNGAAHIIVGRS